jgi:hypothetical protein
MTKEESFSSYATTEGTEHETVVTIPSEDPKSTKAHRVELIGSPAVVLSLDEQIDKASTVQANEIEKRDRLPAQIALHLGELIFRRTSYKIHLEQLIEPPRYLKSRHMTYEAERGRLEQIMSGLYDDIAKIARHYLPGYLITIEPELTIANILAHLPAPEDVVVTKVFHSTG